MPTATVWRVGSQPRLQKMAQRPAGMNVIINSGKVSTERSFLRAGAAILRHSVASVSAPIAARPKYPPANATASAVRRPRTPPSASAVTNTETADSPDSRYPKTDSVAASKLAHAVLPPRRMPRARREA